MSRKRIVVAGLGDTGILAAVRLAPHADVVGISVKEGLVSGQELGMRLSRPAEWARDYSIGFRRFRGLDSVRIVHGTLSSADFSARTVTVTDSAGTAVTEPFDALVISTGVSNGFWRSPSLQTVDQVAAELDSVHDQLSVADTIAIVGGGAAAVSSALNVARTWPGKKVTVYFPGAEVLPGYHQRTRAKVRQRLIDAGVQLNPGHRAVLPADHHRITSGSIEFITGQAPSGADAVLWAVGKARPNTDWLPPELLDDDGFVEVTPELRVPGHPGVYAVGDVAATDPLRTSARNGGGALVARNILAEFTSGKLRRYRPPATRWGSVFGPQSDGLEVFSPWGNAIRFPAWLVQPVLQQMVVRRGLYRGVRD